jgi:alpha-ketoglutarate-dependent 2,4-dichlorophenoxyacetate dioxygenase
MAIAVKQLHLLFAAEIGGVDLRELPSAATFAAIESALDRHAVLVFRDQAIDDDQQIAFTRLFGALDLSVGRLRADQKMRLPIEIADVSNLDENGELLSLLDRRRMYNLGNQLWHTDSSFKRVPAKCSLLSGRDVPPEGGETEFADMRAAYDALDAATRERIEDLVAEHSIFHSRSLIGYVDFTEEERAALPPVPQTMTRIHPGSRRKSIYLASHASHILGWPVEEGRALIQKLVAHATQPQFVYRHHWRAGDLVIWDNRCTMHRGRPYDETRYRRDMRRTTVEDVASTLDQRRAWVY